MLQVYRIWAEQRAFSVGTAPHAVMIQIGGCCRRECFSYRWMVPASLTCCISSKRGRGGRTADGRSGPWPSSRDRGGLEETLILVLEGANAALARKLGCVVQPAQIWRLASKQGFLQELDDGALEYYDLALQLGLSDHWPGKPTVSTSFLGKGRAGLEVLRSPRANFCPIVL